MNQYASVYKDYYIKPSKEHPFHYVIVTVGQGGRIPDVLEGLFTTRTIAIEEINKYLASKPVKDTENANQIVKSGSK